MALFLPLALVLLLLGGGNSLLDHVDPGIFWAQEGIPIDALAFRQVLQDDEPQLAPPDVDAWIRRLGADRFQDREAASHELRRIGAAAEPALRVAEQDNDPEIAMRAKEILSALAPQKPPSPLRRLMALRGLSDLNETQDESLFLRLSTDKDPDVAREAKRALRRLRKEADAPVPALAAADRLLPAETANLLEIELKPFPQEGPPNRVRPLHHGVLPLLEALGNFRVDRITVASSAVMGPQEGWALFVLDGEYDPVRLSAWLKKDKFVGTETRGEFEVLSIGGPMLLLPLSESRLLLVLAGNEKAMPLDALFASLRSPPAESRLPAALTALRTDVPENASLRFFVTTPQTLPLPLEEFKDLKSFRIFGKPKDSGLFLQGSGETTDFQALTTLIASRKQSLQEVRPMLQQNGGMHSKPLIDMIDSLRMTVSEKTYTMELRIPANIYEVIVPFIGFQQGIQGPIEDMDMPEHMNNVEF